MFAKLLVAAGVAALAVFGLAAVTAPDGAPARPPTSVSAVGSYPMVEGHARMTEQMRVAAPTEAMTSRMVGDPMWADRSTGMIRAQEAHEAEIDRMLARR